MKKVIIVILFVIAALYTINKVFMDKECKNKLMCPLHE